MLTSPLPILRHAQAGRYAVPAFNINQLETLLAVIEAAKLEASPVIVQTSEGAVQYAGLDMLIAMVRVAAEAPVPVVLNFDHGKDLPLLKQAIERGYTSVMIDASEFPYLENVKRSRQVAQWARAKGVAVEAEIGRIAGSEDKVNVNAAEANLTDPEEAARFAKESECDCLAISIGTRHGAFKFAGDRHLDLARLKDIRKRVDAPLVLHGASGVREDLVQLAKRFGADLGEMRGTLDTDVKEAVKLGICKVNIDTDLRLAFSAGLREAVGEHPNWLDPRKLFEPGKILMREVARQKMQLFGCSGKAKELMELLRNNPEPTA